MIHISNRMTEVQGQPMFGLLSKANEIERRTGKSMVHLELGDTDFNTPTVVSSAASTAIVSGDTHYVPASGIQALKQEAIRVTQRSRGFTPTMGQLLVTPGANMQIYLALAAVCDPGDTVAIPTPYFPSYVAQAKALGLNIVFYTSVKGLNRIDAKLKAIIINSPSNPTGTVLSAEEVKDVFYIAKFADALLISDEVYSRMVYVGDFLSPSYIDHCSRRTVIVNGFSKSYAMSGWRLGVMTGPEHVIAKCTTLLETILSCVPPFIQRAGVAALQEVDTTGMRNELMKRRTIMWKGLNKIPGVTCDLPAGGMYCWANIKKTRMKSQQFADRALELGVVLCPGTFFGQEGFVRLCFGRSEKDIRLGLRRLRKI